MGENTSVTTVKDEVSGVLSRLCTTSCSDDKALKFARDNLRRLALRIRDGEADYDEVVQCVLEKFHDDKTKDEWFVKYRLLEVFPIFTRAADVHLVSAASSALLHENWMVRQAAVEAIAFIMTQKDGNQPHIASRSASKTNSRPISPRMRRDAGLTAKPRPKHGLVVGELGAVVKGRRRAAANETQVADHEASPPDGLVDPAVRSPRLLAENGGDVLVAQREELESAMEALFRFAKEAAGHEESGVRKCGLQAMAKGLPVGHAAALAEGRAAVADTAWECREASVQLLRELAIVGDAEVTAAVLSALQDARWEVREAAVRALETVAVIGDEELVEQLVSQLGSSKAWAAGTGRKAWELRETLCKALGAVLDGDNERGARALDKALEDESAAVQRAAARALGELGERVAPEDLVWTYNNATAVGGKPSTWLHTSWSSMRQHHLPAPAKAPMERQTKHSPRESRQLLARTPRGGVLPHLLTTPRNEHLYEGDAVAAALEAREQRRAALEKEEELEALAERLAAALELNDTEAVRQIQQQMARIDNPLDPEQELEDVAEGEEGEEEEEDWE